MRVIALSGFMGTGKSTLGPRLASKLGLPFVDTDDEIARRTGSLVPALWRARGEGVFRALEHEVVAELLADGVLRVLALGGGTVTNRQTRHLLLDHALLVTLTSKPETLLARVGNLEDRPALAGPDPLARMSTLLEQRAAAYAECHLTVATDVLSLETTLERIARLASTSRIAVPLGLRTYAVDVVHDAPEAVSQALLSLDPSSLLVVSDENVRALRGEALRDMLAPLTMPRTEVTLPPGEENKTLASVETLWNAALAAPVDRDAVVLGFGGGVVGDLAAFAASTILRGLRVVQLPTTLLAMADSSVGGKTGFDHALGKNLIGSFHQPTTVIADLAHLSTLPARERIAGLAEVAKIALVSDERLWLELESKAELLASGDVAALEGVLVQAIARKAQVVRADETEGGLRVVLNFGHTVGHAIEASGGYTRYRHGEAVALGMLVELRIFEHLGLSPAGLRERAHSLLARLGLPTDIADAELHAAWGYLAVDKKRRRETFRLPIVRALGAASVEVVNARDMAAAVGVTSHF